MKFKVLWRSAMAISALFLVLACSLASHHYGYLRGFESGYELGRSAPVAPLSKASVSDELGSSIRLRVMTFNLHHGEGIDGKLSLERVAGVINQYAPDIVTLQEVDRETERSGRIDQLASLSRLTNLEGVFGKAKPHSGGEYGNAILCRFPIELIETIELPGGIGRESRSAVVGRTEVGGGDQQRQQLLICSTHLDYLPGSKAQLSSVDRIRDRLHATLEVPTILAGDLNAESQSETVRRLQLNWAKVMETRPTPTFPSVDPSREIDHIFCRPRSRWGVRDVFTSEDPGASDHLALIADLVLLAK